MSAILALGLTTVAASPAIAMQDSGTEYEAYENSFLCSSTDGDYAGDETDAGPGQHFVSIGVTDTDRARVQYNADEEAASQPGGTSQQEMINVISGSGVRYAGGKYEFHTKGDEGILSYDGKTETCTKLSNGRYPAENVIQSDVDARIPAMSWGGKLRSGPGMEYDQVGSLYEGAPITVMHNSGVRMNGYDWFKIRTEAGTEAYQWGGIMCVNGVMIVGMFDECK